MAKLMAVMMAGRYYNNYKRILPIAGNSMKTRNIINCFLTTRAQECQDNGKEKYLKQNNVEEKDEPESTPSVHKIIDPTVHNYFAKESSPLKMLGVHKMLDDARLIKGEAELEEVELKIDTSTCGSYSTKPNSELVKHWSVAEREESMEKELLDYVSSVRYISGSGSRPAVMPALDSPYDEFSNFCDLDEPYDTDDDDDNTPSSIEEP